MIKDDIDFLVTSGRFKLTNGKTIKILRPGIGIYYRFLVSIIKARFDYKEVRNCLTLLSHFIDDYESIYLELLTDIRLFTEVKTLIIEFNTIYQKDLEESLNCRIDEPKEEPSREYLLTNVEKMLTIGVIKVAEKTGWTMDYILNSINNIQLHYILHYLTQFRVNDIYDNAAATGNVKDPKEYIDMIKGTIKFEFAKGPEDNE